MAVTRVSTDKYRDFITTILGLLYQELALSLALLKQPYLFTILFDRGEIHCEYLDAECFC